MKASQVASRGSNVLQIPVTWELFKLDEKIRAISVGSPAVTYADICKRDVTGACVRDGCVLIFACLA